MRVLDSHRRVFVFRVQGSSTHAPGASAEGVPHPITLIVSIFKQQYVLVLPQIGRSRHRACLPGSIFVTAETGGTSCLF